MDQWINSSEFSSCLEFLA